ncbi:MAG TPA: primosomal protein N' [Anaerolineales bacterium]|nr:primosomal protein N' [Anaerolineales bacterium]
MRPTERRAEAAGFAEVAVHLAGIQGTFHYHIPPQLAAVLRPGHLVVVSFGARRVHGIVMALAHSAPVPETKPVESLVDPEPVLTPSQMELARWMAVSNRATLAECLAIMLPAGVARRADSLYSLRERNHSGSSETERRLLQLLEGRGPLRSRQLDRLLPHRHWQRAAEALMRRGVVSRESVLDSPAVRPRRDRRARLAVDPRTARRALTDLGDASRPAAARRRAALEALLAEGRPLEITWLYAEAGARPEDLKYLETHGLLAWEEVEVVRDPLAQRVEPPAAPPRLTPDQTRAWEPIRLAIEAGVHGAFLLHGVTGSGKTEVYLHAVEETLRRGRTAIVLVPEIALTPQTVQRFLARFPGQVGLMHSAMSDGERYDTWRRARAGRLAVIVGARSALFAPLPNLGLIVLDEAHDDSYKEQEHAPRYDARSTALAYARQIQAVGILGTATPDVVTYFRTGRGELRLLELPGRILGHRRDLADQAARWHVTSRYEQVEGEAHAVDMPPVHLVDMRQELRAGNRSIFSRRLELALDEALRSGQQAILFLNRRGTASYVFCRDCGWVARCPRCQTPLTYHQARADLLCHHCGYRRGRPTRCPQCRGSRVREFGAGTQRIQAEVERRLPAARTLRWDRDVTRRKGSHDVILAHFAAHRADVLIGTQMLAKGLDLPLVTLVGVISADTGLHLPDYRAAERTFQILSQVAGRAGRGLLGGQVILQTFHPEHHAIQAAAAHDYGAFYRTELSQRRELGYPPFARLARLVGRRPSDAVAEREGRSLAQRIRRAASGTSVKILGPVPCFYARLRGLARWQIILRGPEPAAVLPAEIPDGWAVDVDPVSLL